MSIRNKEDFGCAIFLLALSALLYYGTSIITVHFLVAGGPVFFPRAIIYVLAFLSLILLVRSIDFSGKAKGACDAAKTEKQPIAKTTFLQIGLIGLLVLYLTILPHIGYLYATTAFIFAAILLLGPTSKKHIAVYAIVSLTTAFSLQYLFGSVFKLFLP
jgi:hypothetical protein